MNSRVVGGKKQRRRAVATLEMRRRAVVSFEVSHSSGDKAPIYAGGSWAIGSELWPPGKDATGYSFFHHRRAIHFA